MELLRSIQSYAEARRVERGDQADAEWVHELWPDRADGLVVQRHPLLVLDGDPVHPSTAVEVRILEPGDPDLARVHGAVSVGFAHAGTATGTAGPAERDERAAQRVERAAATSAAIAAGRTVMAGAFHGDDGPVGGGSHHPVGDLTEVVAVGVLPAYRRRGVAAALVAHLAADARARGIGTVFCAATDEAVARVYASVGFRRCGTVCALPGEEGSR